MSFRLVGTRGAVTQSTAGGALTPAYGTGETREVGNLLICWYASHNINTPQTPTGWRFISTAGIGSGASDPAAGLFWKICTGTGEAAPTFAATGSVIHIAGLAEFAGNDPDPVGNGKDTSPSVPLINATTSPQTFTNVQADWAAGDLFVSVWAPEYTAAATKTFSHVLANGATAQTLNSSATSTTTHYDFTYGITTGNTSADSDQFTFTTTKILGVAGCAASFKVAVFPNIYSPFVRT